MTKQEKVRISKIRVTRGGVTGTAECKALAEALSMELLEVYKDWASGRIGILSEHLGLYRILEELFEELKE